MNYLRAEGLYMADIISTFGPLYLMGGVLAVLAMVLRSAWFKGWQGELEMNLVSR